MATEFIRTIRASGGHYSSITEWDSAHGGAFPAPPLNIQLTRVFSCGINNGLVQDDVVTTASGASAIITGMVANNQVLLRNIVGTFQSGDVLTSSNGSVVISDSGDYAILVAELYGDWPNGLNDKIESRFTGHTTFGYVVIRVVEEAKHKMRPLDTPGIFYLNPTTGPAVLRSNVYSELYDIAAVTNDSDAFKIGDSRIVVNGIVYSAPSDRASFSEIDGGRLINCQSTANTAKGFLFSGSTNNQARLFNCADWNSAESFAMEGAFTNAILVNCLGMSQESGLLSFAGVYSSFYNSNNASADSSAPGVNPVHNANPLLEDEINKLKHIALSDTSIRNNGINLTTSWLSGSLFDFDGDYETRPTGAFWTIGPDEPLETAGEIVGIGAATLSKIGANGQSWTNVHGGGGYVMTTAFSANGQGYINMAIGVGSGRTPMVYISSEPYYTAKPITGSGLIDIIGDAQGHAVLQGVLSADGEGIVEPMGAGGATLEAIYGGYVSGIGGIKLRTNIIAGGGAGYKMFDINDNGLFGAMKYRGDFAPKLSAPNYAGGNVWQADEHWLPIPDQYAEAIIAYISYKILCQTGVNNAIGAADFFMQRYEHACKILTQDGTANKIDYTIEHTNKIENNDW